MAGSIHSSAGMLCFSLYATAQTLLCLPGKHHACPSMKANGFAAHLHGRWSSLACPASLRGGRCSVSLGARAGSGDRMDKDAASSAKEGDSSEDRKSYNYLLRCIDN